MAGEYGRLIGGLMEAYRKHAPTSATMQQDAIKYLIDGGSHSLRLIDPFPPRVTSAQGAWVVDEDGHRILDFWQGHFANLLGHNPSFLTSALAQLFETGEGLQTGFTDKVQVKAAEIICQQTGYERIRFTTSGTLATMYAIMLARAYTGKNLVMKAGGGWHGAHPWGLKGIRYQGGFHTVDSAGVPEALTRETVITGYNNCQLLDEHFRRHGDRLACLILEPVIGAGGLMPAYAEYLQLARKLANRYGTVLILDEVISGFRYRAGDAAELLGVKGDLAVFGKIIGGGMPVAAVAGRSDILNLTARNSSNGVKFSGGTYAAHPTSMLACVTMLEYLVHNEEAVYGKLAHVAEEIRAIVSEAFSDAGIYSRFAGDTNHDIPNNSMHMLLFPRKADLALDTPEQIYNPELCDLTLSEIVLPLSMLLEDVYIVHGLGATTTAHNDIALQHLRGALSKAAEKIKPHYRPI